MIDNIDGKVFNAVIFDMDGVVVDSMPFHYEAWNTVFDDLGIKLGKTELYMREGEKGAVTLDHFTTKFGINLSKEESDNYLQKKEKIFKKISKPRIFPGIENVIVFLKGKGIPLALVTGTSLDEVVKLLSSDILESFDVIVSGDMVGKGKPDPEPYLTASSKLGITPEKCLVVENAPYGIKSAKSASMICLAICTSLDENYLKDADIIVNSLDELKGVCEKIQLEKLDNR